MDSALWMLALPGRGWLSGWWFRCCRPSTSIGATHEQASSNQVWLCHSRARGMRTWGRWVVDLTLRSTLRGRIVVEMSIGH